jgi:putative transposase
MRTARLRGSIKKRYRIPSGRRGVGSIAANVLDRQFTPKGPNKSWAADITYIRTDEGWLYLAVVLDLFSRRVVGWSMQDRIGRDLVMAAVAMAIAQRQPKPGLLHHSDRGSQYTSDDFQCLLKEHGIRCSMSDMGTAMTTLALRASLPH